MNDHIKIYTDSAIVINRIVQILGDNGIHALTKDNVESARVAGFGTSYFDVELFVQQSDIEKAQSIIKAFLASE